MVCFATEDIQSTKYLVQDKEMKLIHHRRKKLSKHTRKIEKVENSIDEQESHLTITSPVTFMELEQQRQSGLISPDFVDPTPNISPMSSSNKEANSNHVTFNNVQLFTTPPTAHRFHPYTVSVQKIKPSSSYDANPTNLTTTDSSLRVKFNEQEKRHRENKRREMMKVLSSMKTKGGKISSEVDDTELPLNLSIKSVQTNINENQSNNEHHKDKLFQISEQESIYKREKLDKYYLEKEEQLFTKYIKQTNNKTSHKDLSLQTKSPQECLDYSRSSVIAKGLSKLETNNNILSL